MTKCDYCEDEAMIKMTLKMKSGRKVKREICGKAHEQGLKEDGIVLPGMD